MFPTTTTTTTTTSTAAPCLMLAAARAGKIEISEDYEDLLADVERRQPEKGFTAVLRREHVGIYARGVTPAAAIVALHRVVLDREPAPGSVEAILQLIGEPQRHLQLPVSGLL